MALTSCEQVTWSYNHVELNWKAGKFVFTSCEQVSWSYNHAELNWKAGMFVFFHLGILYNSV